MRQQARVRRAERTIGQGEADADELAAGAGQGDRVLAALAKVREGLTQLGEVDLTARSGVLAREGVREGFRVMQSFEAAWLHLLGDLDERPGVICGARRGSEATTFLTTLLLRTPYQAGADVRAARALRADPAGAGPSGPAGLSGADPAGPAGPAGPSSPDPAKGGLPMMGAALARGDISREHLDVAVEAIAKVPAEALARPLHPDANPTADADAAGGRPAGAVVDEFFAQRSRQLDRHQLHLLAQHLHQVLDPDGADRFDPLGHTRRGLTYAREDSGMIAGKFVLDPVGAAAFKTAIEHFSAPDPARTETADDGTPITIADERTAAQRRADGLAQMSRMSLTHPDTPTGKSNEPARVVIHTGITELAEALEHTARLNQPEHLPEHLPEPGQFAGDGQPRDGSGAAPAAFTQPRRGSDCEPLGPIGPALLARLACDAIFQKALLATNGAVLDLGRDTRTITPAQRRALNARDRGCVIPACIQPPSRCEGHHVTYWRNGGRTDVANLALLCSRHHTLVHLGIWQVVMRDGIAWARPPAWIDPDQRLIRNTLRSDADAARHLGYRLRLTLNQTAPSTTPTSPPAPRRPGPSRPTTARGPAPPSGPARDE